MLENAYEIWNILFSSFDKKIDVQVITNVFLKKKFFWKKIFRFCRSWTYNLYNFIFFFKSCVKVHTYKRTLLEICPTLKSVFNEKKLCSPPPCYTLRNNLLYDFGCILQKKNCFFVKRPVKRIKTVVSRET